MLLDLEKVVKWAARNDCYTNDSCGLHMNVSVPNFSKDKLDYVKLAIFLGDEYVLNQFGRLGNTYCASAMENIRKIAKTEPDKVVTMLRAMQNNLSAMASKIVHTGTTNKYTSINTQDGYIEFRSPGGDWLGEYAADPGKINNTLLRFTVALDVAMKPELHRQEYMKKLYKTLSLGESNDTIKFFARYAAGELPQSALKSFVKQAQLQRKVKKLLPDAIKGQQLIQWRATSGAATATVVARTEEEARKKAAVNIGIPLTDRAVDTIDIQPIDLYTGPVNSYDIFRLDNGGHADIVAGVDERDAIANFRIKRSWQTYDVTAKLHTPSVPQQSQTASGDQEFSGTWEVVSRPTDEVVYTLGGIGNAVQDAERYAARWAEETGFSDPVYVRPRMQPRTTGGGFARAPHTSIYQVVNNRNGQIILGGETRTFAYTVEMANIGIRSYGIAPEDIRIIDMATNRSYNIDGSPANTSTAQTLPNWTYSRRDGGEIAGSREPRRVAEPMTLSDALELLRRHVSVQPDNIVLTNLNTGETFDGNGDRITPVPGSTVDRAQQRAEQRFTVDYTIRQYGDVMNNRVTVPAANADAAMDNVRNQLEASRAEVLRIEAEPIEQAQARGTESLPPGNARWLILDRNGREVYSFVNTTAQSDANQYARQWLTANAQDGQGPYDVVPVSR